MKFNSNSPAYFYIPEQADTWGSAWRHLYTIARKFPHVVDVKYTVMV